MTSAQTNYRKKLIRDIHTSQRYQNYYAEEREEYEALLLDHFGHSSSAKLDITQLKQLHGYLRLGQPLPQCRKASPQQLYKMNELWAVKARTPTATALLAFATRICGRDPGALPELTVTEAQKVIIALEKMEVKDGTDAARYR